MLVSRLPWPFIRSRRGALSLPFHRRWQHDFREICGKEQEGAVPRNQEPKDQDTSLFEELFPEEFKRRPVAKDAIFVEERSIPRLPLPELDEVNETFSDGYPASGARSDEVTGVASTEAYRLWNLAVLVLGRASKSLIEVDFRRNAPKGQHINDWKGPGDLLRVIPARDPDTLQQIGHYFLLFPNPAYARAYQSHIVHTHRLATMHTPTSIESPMSPPQGMIIKGEDVDALLKDYALCTPSQKIALRVLFPPYPPSVRRLLTQRGYPQLVRPDEKTGRSVLFWVNGYQPSTMSIRTAIGEDGRDRGLHWALPRGTQSIELLDVADVTEQESEESEDLEEFTPSDSVGKAESSTHRRIFPRWIISFEDEDEARRFVRAWHRRPFPISREPLFQDEPAPLVHAEYVW